MSHSKVLIASVPGMLEEEHWRPLQEHAQVDYIESDHMDSMELAPLCSGYEYLMLNYDLVQRLPKDFYAHPGVSNLKGISCDITGMN